MKIFRLIAAVAFLTAIAFSSAYAQGTTRPAAPAQSPAGGGQVPDAKIAFIDTGMFSDDKAGITRFVNAMKSLEREFKPRQDDLNGMQVKINAIADDIKKTQNVADPKAIQAKQDEGERLVRELDFKKKGAEADFQKRYQEVVGPISDDITKSIDSFRAARGYTVILDINQLARAGAILSMNESADVTKAFIAEYNSKNPATAAR
ncbi:MAG: OmpH family outer membrane protein [Pyrinomonadaceae bacterium]